MKHELVIVLDFGGLNAQSIARCVRDNNIYCEVLPETYANKLAEKNPKAIIITGSPNGVLDEDLTKSIFDLNVPVLGIDYGYEYIGKIFGMEFLEVSEEKKVKFNAAINNKSILFSSLPSESEVFLNKNRFVREVKNGFEATSNFENLILSIENKEKNIFGAKFFVENEETKNGNEILKNFLINICKLSGDWKMSDFVNEKVLSLKEKIGDKKVLCALSGGVDSSVCAVMVHKAVKDQLTCIFVDTGLMRLNEGDEVMEEFSKFGMNVIRVDAEERFLQKLKGVSDPETKRKIIGEEFIRVFEEEAKKIGSVDFLVQGTIYPDIIESGTKNAEVIKSHHNVGGLPDVIDFKEILEPLRDLFKDEVRQAGLVLGIDEELVFRQPFPGPGLAVRVIGDLTKEKLDLLRKTDFIYRDEIKKAGLNRKIWQYFTVLTGLRSVGVVNEKRTYGHTIALRAVTSVDAMTANLYKIPYEILEKVSERITTEVPEVTRIVLDITNKPPSTIEWE